MKNCLRIYAIALLALIVISCGPKEETEEQRLTWSSEAPLSIPHRVRMKQTEKANLVRNHSFETGKTFMLDSMKNSFAIDGWQQVGRNVEWVDVRKDSIYKSNEALSGYRAVKIVRKQAYETDEPGEGIMSDFIKVIPGNYSLSFYSRIENAFPQRARLGTRMFDAIDIRLMYYDRNKIAISPKQPYPQADQVVDNSFKSLSFANFDSVPAFGWGKIIGKSAYYPFPEGDIPSPAHYVKIFIGLKGKGTMWIDSVSYSYTAANFSIAERMGKYTDTSFYMQPVILPTPRKVQKMESVIFYHPGQDAAEQPIILIPDNADTLVRRAAQMIREALLQSIRKAGGKTGAGDVPIINRYEDLVPGSKLVFSLGNNGLSGKFNGLLPYPKIASRPQGYFLYTTSDLSNLVFLGANTSTGIYYAALTAVQLVDDRKPVFHNVLVIDYPGFENRYITTGNMKIAAGEMVKYKVNGAVFLNEKDSEILPLLLENSLFRLEKQFYGIISNEMLDAIHARGGTVAAHANFLYTGCSFYSTNTDDADLSRFVAFSGAKPVFMDNSMLTSSGAGQTGGNYPFYPGKARLFNLIEPYSNVNLREQLQAFDSSLFVVNFPVNSELDIIRMATASDFMWNGKEYSPELSLWKVLLSRYGAIVARDLIDYSDKYGMMLEIIMRLKKNEQVARNIKNGQFQLSSLEKQASALNRELGASHPLVKEIGMLNAAMKKQLSVFLTRSRPKAE